MRVSTQEFFRRRPWLGIAGSLVLHLLVIGVLLWAKPPVSRLDVKRGEPLFVELPKGDEAAMRGLPGAPGAEPAKPTPPAARPAPPAPRVAKAQPAPATEPKAAAPARPAPPAVAKAPTPPAPAPPAPKEERAADVPAEKPAAARPSEPQPKEAPRESVEPGGPPRVASVPPSAPPAPDIRSALGRAGSGTGGAGGRGEGRAGIEGEPIPLDSKNPAYSDYLDQVRRRIKAKWVYPCVKSEATGQCEYKSTQLVIEFGILRDGRVPFVIVRRQSEFDIYDEYAVNAIKLASPFPPVPDALMSGSKKGIPILATFSYIVESSLTNLLR
jgi:outer membrane biosynthesis protein TonB